MLLTLVCIVVRGGPSEGGSGAADISRRNLYDEAERLLLHRWDTDRGLPLAEGGAVARLPRLSFEEKRSFFLRVAATMMETAEADELKARTQFATAIAQFDPTHLPDSNQISEAQLISILAEVAPKDDPRAVLTILRERNYLLCYRGDGTYSFIHRSFLEYFTALNWAEGYTNGDFTSPADLFATVIEPRWQNETWHETLRFLIALLKNPVAVQCLDLLAALPPRAQAGDMVQKGGGPIQRERPALVLAAELTQEVSPYIHTGGSRPGPLPKHKTLADLKAKWQTELVQFACSAWDGKERSREPDGPRFDLRQRALDCLALLWRGDAGVRAAILQFFHVEKGPVAKFSAVGKALQAGWGTTPEAKAALLRVVIGVPQEEIAPDANRDVRWSAVEALGAGWAGDGEVKAACLRAAIGVPEQGVAPDMNVAVRWTAMRALKHGWGGDADVQALVAKRRG